MSPGGWGLRLVGGVQWSGFNSFSSSHFWAWSPYPGHAVHRCFIPVSLPSSLRLLSNLHATWKEGLGWTLASFCLFSAWPWGLSPVTHLLCKDANSARPCFMGFTRFTWITSLLEQATPGVVVRKNCWLSVLSAVTGRMKTKTSNISSCYFLRTYHVVKASLRLTV